MVAKNESTDSELIFVDLRMVAKNESTDSELIFVSKEKIIMESNAMSNAGFSVCRTI